MNEPIITIVAVGVPGPQGSKHATLHKHSGRVVTMESSKKVGPWRQAVREAAAVATGPACARLGLAEWEALDGPLILQAVFSLPRGRTVKRTHHTTYPDLSKLLRSTEDALTEAGIWADDARVVGYHDPRKVYAGDVYPDALAMPGAVIRIWAVEVTSG